MEGHDMVPETLTEEAPRKLRLRTVEGSDAFEAEGDESMVMHLHNEWKTRVDGLRADASAMLDRLTQRRGEGDDLRSRIAAH